MKTSILSTLLFLFAFSCAFSQGNFTINTLNNPGNGPLTNTCLDCLDAFRLTSAQNSTNTPYPRSTYWYSQTVDFTQDFVASFSIRFSNIARADGIAFVFQNLDQNFIGWGGGYLGIYDGVPTHQAIVSEFDIFDNGSSANAIQDGMDDHFAVNGSTDHSDVIVNPVGITLTNNVWHNVIVTWSCNELRYIMGGQLLATLQVDDVLNAFNQNLPTSAILGFSAGTGSSANDQDVCFQTFTQFAKPSTTCESNILVDCGDSLDLNSSTTCCSSGTQGEWVDQDGQVVPNGLLNNITEPGVYSRQTMDDCSICTQIVYVTVSSPTYEIILTPLDADFVFNNGTECCLAISVSTLIDEINEEGISECNFDFSDFPDEFEEWPIVPPSDGLLLLCSDNSYYVEAGCCLIEFTVSCQIPRIASEVDEDLISSKPSYTVEKLTPSENSYVKRYIKENNDDLFKREASTNRNDGFEVFIQPNPSEGKVRIVNRSDDSTEIQSIEILDELGRRISVIEHLTNGDEIDLSHLTNGIYFLRVANVDNETITKQVILN